MKYIKLAVMAVDPTKSNKRKQSRKLRPKITATKLDKQKLLRKRYVKCYAQIWSAIFPVLSNTCNCNVKQLLIHQN